MKKQEQKKNNKKKRTILLATLIPLGTAAVATAVAVPLVLKKGTPESINLVLDEESTQGISIVGNTLKLNTESTITFSTGGATSAIEQIVVKVGGKELTWDQTGAGPSGGDYRYEYNAEKEAYIITIYKEAMINGNVSLKVTLKSTPTVEVAKIKAVTSSGFVGAVGKSIKATHVIAESLDENDQRISVLTWNTDYTITSKVSGGEETIINDFSNTGYKFTSTDKVTFTVKYITSNTTFTSTFDVTPVEMVEPLAFEASSSITMTWTKKNDSTLQYSYDGLVWLDCGTTLNFSSSRKFYFKGKFTNTSTDYNQIKFANSTGSPSVTISGSILSLLNDGAPVDTLPEYAFYHLFDGSKSIKAIDETTCQLLPFTSLSKSCYAGMFYGCTSLTNAPTLPAGDSEGQLANECYKEMFRGCTSLTAGPALPAKTLKDNCYEGMFFNTGLITCPELPATTLAPSCYTEMFNNCDSLTTAPKMTISDTTTYTTTNAPMVDMFYGCAILSDASGIEITGVGEYLCYHMFHYCYCNFTSKDKCPKLNATTLAPHCYGYMFERCEKMTIAPELPAETLAEACYEYMFWECYALTTPPSTLPATTLQKQCYWYMFGNCSNAMATAPIIKATTLAEYSCFNMFISCKQLKVKSGTTTGTPFFTCPGTIPSYAVQNMFESTGGEITGSASANTTYSYYSE